MRNFNFFIIITGALLAGYARPGRVWNLILDGSGTLVSLVFLGLDVRGYGLHRRAVDQMTLLEPIMWSFAGVEGWTPAPTHGGARILSHRWLYRSLFCIGALAWVVALLFTILSP
jgi:hypothetical protein